MWDQLSARILSFLPSAGRCWKVGWRAGPRHIEPPPPSLCRASWEQLRTTQQASVCENGTLDPLLCTSNHPSCSCFLWAGRPPLPSVTCRARLCTSLPSCPLHRTPAGGPGNLHPLVVEPKNSRHRNIWPGGPPVTSSQSLCRPLPAAGHPLFPCDVFVYSGKKTEP